MPGATARARRPSPAPPAPAASDGLADSAAKNVAIHDASPLEEDVVGVGAVPVAAPFFSPIA